MLTVMVICTRILKTDITMTKTAGIRQSQCSCSSCENRSLRSGTSPPECKLIPARV